MKYCEEYAALLDAFIDGECSETETARVREHLSVCDGCSAYVQDGLLMRSAFPCADDTEVPGGFAEGVMAAIRVDAAPRRHRGGQWKKALVPLAACLAIVVAVGQLPTAGSTAASAPAASSPASAASASAAPEGAAADAENQASPVQGTQNDTVGGGAESKQFGINPAASNAESEPETAVVSAALATGEGRNGDVRQAKVTLTAEQTERLLSGYAGEPSGEGEDTHTVYTLTETEFAAVLEALAAEVISVEEIQLDTETQSYTLLVYPAA